MIYRAARLFVPIILLTVLLPLTAPAKGATITVAAGEVVTAANGTCSLREAIHNANDDTQVDNTDCPAGTGDDVIQLAASSTYTLSDEDPAGFGDGLDEISGTLVIEGNGATIERDGALTCTLDGTSTADEFRLIRVSSSGDLTLRDVTLRGGCADGFSDDDGGAIQTDGGNLTLERVVVENNMARDKSGGLDTQRNAGVVTIVDSTFRGNHGDGGGGGIGNGSNVTMTITGSTISGNTSGGDGGGGGGNFGELTICNSTITGNSSTGTGGGGVGNAGGLTIENSTISNNSVTGGLGGGGLGNAALAAVKSSIIGDNTTGGDCSNVGTFSAEGLSFDTDGSCVAFDASFTQVTSGDLGLGPLTDNGGPTETIGFLTGVSVAIDAVTDCTRIDGLTPVGTDQRGVSRPQDGDATAAVACDVGAFEQETAPETLVVDGVCTLGDAIEAANTDETTVGGCVDTQVGPDILQLDVDVSLTVADTVRSTETSGAYAGLPDVTSQITILAGAGDTIQRTAGACLQADQADEFRLLQVRDGGFLVLDGLSLVGGCADMGAGILVHQGGFAALDSTFYANRARSDTFTAQGGAVRAGNLADAISISGCTFDQNDVVQDADSNGDAAGGAVFIGSASGTIRDTDFLGNKADASANNHGAQGGAVFFSSLPLSLRDSTFEGNVATGSSPAGGAVYVEDGAEMSGCQFIANEAVATIGTAEGGAVVTLSGGSPVYSDLVFRNNVARSLSSDAIGGAMVTSDLGSMTRVRFEGNLAEGGIGAGSGSVTAGPPEKGVVSQGGSAVPGLCPTTPRISWKTWPSSTTPPRAATVRRAAAAGSRRVAPFWPAAARPPFI